MFTKGLKIASWSNSILHPYGLWFIYSFQFIWFVKLKFIYIPKSQWNHVLLTHFWWLDAVIVTMEVKVHVEPLQSKCICGKKVTVKCSSAPRDLWPSASAAWEANQRALISQNSSSQSSHCKPHQQDNPKWDIMTTMEQTDPYMRTPSPSLSKTHTLTKMAKCRHILWNEWPLCLVFLG